MGKRLWLIRLIGIILLIFILTRIELPDIVNIIANVKPWYLALAVVLSLPLILLKSWRWQLLLKMQGTYYPLRQAFPAYFSGVYLGLATPGRLGDFARIFYLTDEAELSAGEAFSSVLVDRLCDVYLLLIIGGYGLITFSPLGKGTIFTVIILALILVISFALLNRWIGKRLMGLVYKARVFKRFEKRLDTSIDQFYSGVEGLAKKELIFPLLLTLAAYAIYFGQCYLLALSLSLDLSFLYVASSMAVTILITMLPISVAGIGTRDATLIALFSFKGITAELALSYSLLVLFVFYIFTGVMGAIAWQIKPIKVSKGS